MPVVKTLVQAAELCGVSRQTLGLWKKELGYPARDDGEYDTDAILTWRATRDRQIAKEQAAAEDLAEARELRREKIRNMRIKNDNAELESQRRRGAVYPRELVVDVLSIYAAEISGAINHMRSKGHVVAAQALEERLSRAEKKINELIDRTIREFAK